jgi:aspartate kinase
MLMLGERPPRSVDEAVPTGERLSALLVAEALRVRGVPAEPVNGVEAIVTDCVFGNASPLMPETTAKASARLMTASQAGRIPIVTGFCGATIDGIPTTLGRGGSDFSASILAAALNAQELWIWTDVDGILSADPRLVANTRVLPEVTYNEAAELAYNGAKVLHPRTLIPLAERQIPVWIKNSFSPEKPGTRIGPAIGDVRGAHAITSLGKVALISIEAVSPTMSGAQLMARALEAAARTNVEVLLLTRSSFRQNFCMLVRSDELDAVMQSLRAELALEIAHNYVHPIDVDNSVGLLAIVGEGMRGTPGLAGKLFTAISRQNINIIAIAQGSSELTIAVVVKQNALEDAVRAVHAECRLDQPQPEPVDA